MGNTASTVPYGAQSNAIRVPLSCDYKPFPQIYFDTSISLTVPLSGASGQQINITDATARVVLPTILYVSITDSGGFDHLYLNTSITFETSNASPQEFVVNQFNTTLNFTGGSIDFPPVNIPAAGETLDGVLPPIGLILLGQPGQAVIGLRSVAFAIKRPYDDYNTLRINCNPDPEYVLATIVVVDDSEPGPLLAPANNAPVNLPALALGQQSTVASIPISCTEDVINPAESMLSNAFNYTLSASAPVQLTRGQVFNVSNVNNYLTIPGENAYDSTALYGSGTCGLFTRLVPQNGLPGLGLSYANAMPDSVDVSNTFVASDANTPNPLVTGRYVDCLNQSPVTFPFPNLGHLDLVGIVPSNQTGSIFSVGFTGIQGNIEVLNVDHGSSGCETFTCQPLVQPVLLSAPIV